MPYKYPNDPINIEKARLSRRKHYLKNKSQYRKNNIIKKKRMFCFISKIKNTPCMDCGNLFPTCVMDFDHREQKDKSDTIGAIINRGSWKLLQQEIDKCDIVCSNCHRIRTAKQLNYRDYLGMSVNG